MKKLTTLSLFLVFLFGTAFFSNYAEKNSATQLDWALNATTIEACTCTMFCQCYFNSEPAGHGSMHGESEHYCKFNMAWRVNEGHYGETDLTDAVFWIAGDLGEGWDDGTMEWAVVHFDPSVTEEQREGITNMLGPIFPVKWNSFTVGEDKAIMWDGGSKESVALLDDGKSAEIRLKHPHTALTSKPVTLTNLQYWGAPRNEGFILMPNEVQAYREGEKAFESRGTNGFMITIDITSNDV